MAKVIFEYDSSTGEITDSNGLQCWATGLTPFGKEDSNESNRTSSAVTLQLIKQGLTADEVIKLKNQDLI